MKKFILLVATLVAVLSVSVAMAQDTPTVGLGGNDELGTFFVGSEGMTLYVFTNDEAGVSNCAGDCATNWPPLTVEEGVVPTLEEGISGQLGVITRDDESRQVTYNGSPLYYWINDEAVGDATGHNAGDVWFVATMPSVGLAGNDDLGRFLVGANGMTLYVFTNDEAGVSNCAGDCATNWPPLTVESEDALTTQAGLAGEFGVIERADGDLQVTVDDMPLYYWINDEVAGDITGHNAGDVWFVATLPTIAMAENEELGTILTGANGMTLYTFTNDEAGVSNCADACATNWPPMTVAANEELVIADGIEGEFGVIERADGSLQVTLNDMPLYYWINDVVAGDTTGHNAGDVWFVAQS